MIGLPDALSAESFLRGTPCARVHIPATMTGMPDEEIDEIPAGGVSIAAVSEVLGIPVPTIRSWERRYGFPAPSRTNGRHRRYRSGEVKQLRALRDLIIKGLSARDAVARLRSATTGTAPEPDPYDVIVRAAIDLDAIGLGEALDRSAERSGVEETILRVALPAMREIGARWKAGVCDIGQEHLATEAVRTWLTRQISMAPPPFRRGPIVLAWSERPPHDRPRGVRGGPGPARVVVPGPRGDDTGVGASLGRDGLASTGRGSDRPATRDQAGGGRVDRRRERPPRGSRLLRRGRLRHAGVAQGDRWCRPRRERSGGSARARGGTRTGRTAAFSPNGSDVSADDPDPPHEFRRLTSSRSRTVEPG